MPLLTWEVTVLSLSPFLVIMTLRDVLPLSSGLLGSFSCSLVARLAYCATWVSNIRCWFASIFHLQDVHSRFEVLFNTGVASHDCWEHSLDWRRAFDLRRKRWCLVNESLLMGLIIVPLLWLISVALWRSLVVIPLSSWIPLILESLVSIPFLSLAPLGIRISLFLIRLLLIGRIPLVSLIRIHKIALSNVLRWESRWSRFLIFVGEVLSDLYCWEYIAGLDLIQRPRHFSFPCSSRLVLGFPLN